MNAYTSTHDNAEKLRLARLDLEDVTDRAELANEIRALGFFDDVSPAARLQIDAGGMLYDRVATNDQKYTSMRRLSYVLLLNGLIQSPAAVTAALQRLRDELITLDPALATLAAQTACTGAPPLPESEDD